MGMLRGHRREARSQRTCRRSRPSSSTSSADPPPGDAVRPSPSRSSCCTTSRTRRLRWPRSVRLLRPGGRIALSDLDTEDGTFHSAEAEGIHHQGFDRAALAELARNAGFVDVEIALVDRHRRRGSPLPGLPAARPQPLTSGDAGRSRSASRPRRRRRSRPPSTGRAGRAPARPRNWPSRHSPTTRRATRSSRRRPASRSRRSDYEVVERTGGGGGTDFGVPSSITDLDRPAGRRKARPSAWHASSRRPGPSSPASPPARRPSSARVRAAAAGTATR